MEMPKFKQGKEVTFHHSVNVEVEVLVGQTAVKGDEVKMQEKVSVLAEAQRT